MAGGEIEVVRLDQGGLDSLHHQGEVAFTQVRRQHGNGHASTLAQRAGKVIWPVVELPGPLEDPLPGLGGNRPGRRGVVEDQGDGSLRKFEQRGQGFQVDALTAVRRVCLSFSHRRVVTRPESFFLGGIRGSVIFGPGAAMPSLRCAGPGKRSGLMTPSGHRDISRSRRAAMSQRQWTAVDAYIAERLVPADPALDAALAANQAAGLPSIDVAPNMGKLLHLLARVQGAQKILEIGTLGGYSTIWLARALPAGGRLVTLEADPRHAEVARSNIARAGLSETVQIRLGKAAESLDRLYEEGAGPFDLIFIDADKANIPAYLQWSLKLARRGSLIICDNVVRDGAVVDADSSDPAVRGVREFFDMLAAEPRLSATALQTLGSKGYDGFAMALVIGE